MIPACVLLVALGADSAEPLAHDDRDRARALFELSRADIKTLHKSRLEVADDLLATMKALYATGKVSTNSISNASSLRSRAALTPTRNSVPESVLREEWNYRFEAYRIAKARDEAALIDRASYAEIKLDLLETEIQLALCREKKSK